MRKQWLLVVFLCGLAFPSAASANVVAAISLSQQRVDVSVNGWPAYSWPVSTARRGYVTPTGSYRPIRTARMWYSRKYDMSPMPYSVFFRGGYAIHGTGYVRSLGRPASHGCVRLHPTNAATFYNLVRAQGLGNARIVITR
ncbi:L,D-transpeptidase [Hansschlegelia plantiphila]|uniref:L,D-transpeptidase n=1 Tax=Hansschlegelia plantiphila TaxID=374655 RepID=A0A9W6MX74_9HYPH|nr:L,D-transpeptidase [Hansschlegelia plantiphila]GLK69625.1 L,D-transpeptidase [Hansschlegelia plantiphila]